MKNKDEEMSVMSISIHTLNMAIDVPVSSLVEDIGNAMGIDAELQMLKTYIIRGMLQKKDDLQSTLGGYWPIRHELAMIGGITMKGK